MAPPDRAKFTLVAGQAMDFATSFNAFFARGLPGPVHHAIDLTTPAGPSTEGGKLATQHVRLLPQGGGVATVVGSVNPAAKTAEVRTFDAIAAVHAQRFGGTKPPIDEAAYGAFSRDLRGFLEMNGYRVSTADAAPALPAVKRGGSGALAVVLLALIALAAAVFAWWRMRG